MSRKPNYDSKEVNELILEFVRSQTEPVSIYRAHKEVEVRLKQQNQSISYQTIYRKIWKLAGLKKLKIDNKGDVRR